MPRTATIASDNTDISPGITMPFKCHPVSVFNPTVVAQQDESQKHPQSPALTAPATIEPPIIATDCRANLRVFTSRSSTCKHRLPREYRRTSGNKDTQPNCSRLEVRAVTGQGRGQNQTDRPPIAPTGPTAWQQAHMPTATAVQPPNKLSTDAHVEAAIHHFRASLSNRLGRDALSAARIEPT